MIEDYYYDLLLNFQDSYCMFYEWDNDDVIEYIKKIPLFHVDTKTLMQMITKIIKIERPFLELIKDKTRLKGNKTLKYACLMGDGKNSVALEFNEDGVVISKSSLILEDELNINEFMYNVNLREIKYEIIKKEELKKETRQELKIKKILKMEIETVYQKKEYSKLKYLYLEWFKELLPSVDEMYERMLKKLNERLTDGEYNIYELIKLSYNNV